MTIDRPAWGDTQEIGKSVLNMLRNPESPACRRLSQRLKSLLERARSDEAFERSLNVDLLRVRLFLGTLPEEEIEAYGRWTKLREHARYKAIHPAVLRLRMKAESGKLETWPSLIRIPEKIGRKNRIREILSTEILMKESERYENCVGDYEDNMSEGTMRVIVIDDSIMVALMRIDDGSWEHYDQTIRPDLIRQRNEKSRMAYWNPVVEKVVGEINASGNQQEVDPARECANQEQGAR